MGDRVHLDLITKLEAIYGVMLDEGEIGNIHVTTLKLFVTILDLLRPSINAVLNGEWLTKYRNNELMIIYEFTNSVFRGPLALHIEEYFENNDIFTVYVLRQGVYRAIFDYIFAADRYYTPWHLIGICRDEDGESLFKTMIFPSDNITVEVYFEDGSIIYDLDYDEFMGILFEERVIGVPRLHLIIMGIRVLPDSFDKSLNDYLEVTTNITTFRLTYQGEIAQFDNIGFLSGFCTMLSHIHQNATAFFHLNAKLEYIDNDLADYQEVAIKLG